MKMELTEFCFKVERFGAASLHCVVSADFRGGTEVTTRSLGRTFTNQTMDQTIWTWAQSTLIDWCKEHDA